MRPPGPTSRPSLAFILMRQAESPLTWGWAVSVMCVSVLGHALVPHAAGPGRSILLSDFAKWLGQVFGGPALYSDQYGEHAQALARYQGMSLSEEQRERWVELICRAARETGLATTPEFWAAFTSYAEWGPRSPWSNPNPVPRRPRALTSLVGTGDPRDRPKCLPSPPNSPRRTKEWICRTKERR